MKIVDLNILLNVRNVSSNEHVPCLAWWQDSMARKDAIRIPWIVLVGFLRVATSTRAFDLPLSTTEAVEEIDAWLAEPNVAMLYESDNHLARMKSLMMTGKIGGNLVNDAHLAALAIEHGATLVSCDSDFSRFKNLRWENPLAV